MAGRAISEDDRPPIVRRCPGLNLEDMESRPAPTSMDKTRPARTKTAGSKRISRTHSSNLLRFSAPRLPDQKPALGVRYRVVEQKSERRQHDDPGEDRIYVEGAFCLQDHVAHPFRRAKIFAHHRADKSEPDGVVQAG